MAGRGARPTLAYFGSGSDRRFSYFREFNTSPSEMFDGLWPTDHAAIVATIGLDPLPQS